MEADLQEQLAFVLTGRAGAGLSPIAPLRLRPATLARYRTLTTLRHDYPLVLASGAGGEPVILSLSGLIDALLGAVGVGGDAERLRHHAFRLERKIREAVAAGATGTLSVLWDQAERQLLTKGEPLLKDSCARLRGALSVDGEVVGCDRALPVRLFTHVWQRAQARKVRRLQEEIDRLARKLSDILGAAEANSETGLSADRLRASLGRAFANDFDFGTMSRVLTTTRPMVRLSDARRARVEHLLATLRAHGFAPADFVFKTLGDALEERVRSMFEERLLLEGLLMDTAGWAAIELLVRDVRRRLIEQERPAGRSVTHRLGPGHRDWPVEEQVALVRIFGETSLPVSLSESVCMLPQKSISAVYGIVPAK